MVWGRLAVYAILTEMNAKKGSPHALPIAGSTPANIVERSVVVFVGKIMESKQNSIRFLSALRCFRFYMVLFALWKINCFTFRKSPCASYGCLLNSITIACIYIFRFLSVPANCENAKWMNSIFVRI